MLCFRKITGRNVEKWRKEDQLLIFYNNPSKKLLEPDNVKVKYKTKSHLVKTKNGRIVIIYNNYL